MGIYLPNMEMPKSCYFCEMYEADLYWCSAAKRDIDSFDDYDNRSSFCPLVPVPPHGRLIDADADPNNYTTAWECHCSEYGNQTVMATEALYDFPTIIQADPAEEG